VVVAVLMFDNSLRVSHGMTTYISLQFLYTKRFILNTSFLFLRTLCRNKIHVVFLTAPVSDQSARAVNRTISTRTLYYLLKQYKTAAVVYIYAVCDRELQSTR
jgi:hypothetical protein